MQPRTVHMQRGTVHMYGVKGANYHTNRIKNVNFHPPYTGYVNCLFIPKKNK